MLHFWKPIVRTVYLVIIVLFYLSQSKHDFLSLKKMNSTSETLIWSIFVKKTTSLSELLSKCLLSKLFRCEWWGVGLPQAGWTVLWSNWTNRWAAHYIIVLWRDFDQGHLHPLLGHPDTGNRTRVTCVAGEHSSKELFEQLLLLIFGTTYVKKFIYCTYFFFSC